MLKVYSKTVPENIGVGSQVIQVSAVDADVGSNSALRYVMSPSSSSSSSSSWFAVNERSGDITVVKSLDRERSSEMQFYVSLISYSCRYKYS